MACYRVISVAGHLIILSFLYFAVGVDLHFTAALGFVFPFAPATPGLAFAEEGTCCMGPTGSATLGLYV